MAKSKSRRRPPTVAELEAQLERARRREAHPAGEYAYRETFGPPRVDLANLDTPDVSHDDQWAAFLNRPGRFYVAQIEIPLDDEPLGEKLCSTATLKADDAQLPYLVEVLRQVRGALGQRCRISLSRAKPTEDRRERELLDHARPRVTVDGIEHLTGRRDMVVDIDELIERSSLGTPAAKAARDSVSYERADEIVRRAEAMRDERPATAEELAAVREMRRQQADARNGFQLPPPNGHHPPESAPWSDDREYTREELAAMMPGQTRAEMAAELGTTPEAFGGTVHHADVMPEELAAELGVPVESLRRIPITGGGYAWTITRPTVPEAGRHAAPDEAP